MQLLWKKLWGKDKYLNILQAVLIISFLLFVIHIQDYGLSFDESNFYEFAQRNLAAIKNAIYGIPYAHIIDFYDLHYYGPAYMIIGNVLVDLLMNLSNSLDRYDVWHALNFSTFLTGAWLIYLLCRKFASNKSSLFGALLYLTQPLLWGHGVMNPKDIPFMVCFLAAITAGITAFDKIQDNLTNRDRKILISSNLGRPLIIILCLAGSLCLFCLVDRLTANSISKPILNLLIDKLQSSQFDSISFTLSANQTTGIDQRVLFLSDGSRARYLVNLIEFIYISAVILFMTIIIFLKISSSSRQLVIAAALLGLTSSIRPLGIAAGGLIYLYAILRTGKKSVKYLACYYIVAVIVIYAVWPYLWSDPFRRFIENFRVMINFPWPATVRFEGLNYPAQNLPFYYLPKLITIQLTLPLVVLCLLGMGLAAITTVKQRASDQKLMVMFTWFFIPILIFMIFRPTLYDNFRQLLFIIPPMFVFAAIAMEMLLKVKRYWSVVWFISLLMPGLIAGVWLHPYEYVYYNSLVGWTGNIERKYENDYWGTSMCEAGRFLDKNASRDSVIAINDGGLASIAQDCADHNLKFVIERDDLTEPSPDYSVVWSRFNDDLKYYQTMKPLMTIHRGGTVFSIIKTK